MGYVPGSETNNIPFGVPLALGKYTELQGVNKFGYNDAVPNTFETVWDNSSVYTWLTSASVITVTSSSTADNGGTVCVIGLDENLLPVEEVHNHWRRRWSDHIPTCTQIGVKISQHWYNKCWCYFSISRCYYYSTDISGYWTKFNGLVHCSCRISWIYTKL